MPTPRPKSPRQTSRAKPARAKSSAHPAPRAKKRVPALKGKRTPAKKVIKKKKPKAPFVAPRAAPAENPEAKALAHRIAQLVLEKKAKDVLVLDVRGLTSYADYFVVASGESERQVSAMAEGVQTSLKQENRYTVGSEGQGTGNWILLDYGEVVAHLFHEETRTFYDLEGLWADAPREKVA